jgi:hypothetical protein
MYRRDGGSDALPGVLLQHPWDARGAVPVAGGGDELAEERRDLFERRLAQQFG